jgi:glycosyltransferase involved in cell wall biosynthesis
LPTFNRPSLLGRALASLVNQTWKNLEIVVSDNASSDPAVAETLAKFCEKDRRIRVCRQEENIGATANFFFVLKQSRGDYFMWAADDDYIAPWFVERSLQRLWSDDDLAMATAEAQYITIDNQKLEFIAEGEAFRNWRSTEANERIHYLLKHNYGNLVYGLFCRDSLIQDGEVFWERSGQHSLNEIPPLLFAAITGNIYVAPDIGLYKQAPASVHAQVEWELCGGRLPTVSRMSGLRSVYSTWLYHSKSLRHIRHAVSLLPISELDKRLLNVAARRKLVLHFIYMFLGYKPRVNHARD